MPLKSIAIGGNIFSLIDQQHLTASLLSITYFGDDLFQKKVCIPGFFQVCLYSLRDVLVGLQYQKDL